MTDTAIVSPNGTAPAGRPTTRAVGFSGVAHFDGVLRHDDPDEAWRGYRRDKTIAAMLNDPLIGAVLSGVEMLVRRVDWRVDPADDDEASKEAAEFVRTCLADMTGHWPGDALAQVLTFLGWGWSVLEVTHKQRLGPTGKPPSRFDDGRIGWRKWAIRPQVTRYGWVFDNAGEPIGLIQQDPMTYQRATVPLARCLTFRATSRDNSPEGFTPLRVAYDAWYHKRKLQTVEGIGLERRLAGLPVMYIPGENIAAADAVYLAAQDIVTGIRQDSQAGAVIAGDRDESGNRRQQLELLTGQNAQAADTDAIIRRYANEIVTVFLANVMRTGQDGIGALALAETQSGLFQQAIGAHLDTVADVLNEQAIGPLCRLNGIPVERVPAIAHGDIESADLARLGAYLVSLATAGILHDTPELRAFVHEVAGLPVPEPDELPEMPENAEAEPEPEPEPEPGRQLSEPLRFADVGTYGSRGHQAAFRAFVERTDRHEARIERAVAALFRRQEAAVLERLRAEPARSWQVRFDEAAASLAPFDREEWLAEFRRVIGPFIRGVVDDAAAAALAELPVAFGFDVLDPNVIAFLQDRAQRFAVRVNGTTWDRLTASLADGIRAGEGVDTLAGRVRSVMGARIRSDATTIARSEVLSSYNAGSLLSAKQSGVVQTKTWMCVAGDTRVSGVGVSFAARRRYRGEMIELTTASGRVLSVTAQHPVLTRRGWVAADGVHEGDDLVSDRVGGEWTAPRAGMVPDVDHVPTEIMQSFGAAADIAAQFGTVRRVVDFDREGRQREIEVVPIDGDLSARLEPAYPKRLRQLALELSDLRLGALLADRVPMAGVVAHAATGVSRAGGSDAAGDDVLAVVGGSDDAGFGSTSDRFAGIAQDAADGRLRARPSLGERSQRCPGSVFGNDGGGASVEVVSTNGARHGERGGSHRPSFVGGLAGDSHAPGFGRTAERDPGAAQAQDDSTGRTPEPAGDLLRRRAASVLFGYDRCVSVKRSLGDCHVYDYTTETGWMIANGLVVHNSALDDRTRESHVAAHGQTVGLDEDFVVGGARGPAPGQMGQADVDINCRCSLLFGLTESEEG